MPEKIKTLEEQLTVEEFTAYSAYAKMHYRLLGMWNALLFAKTVLGEDHKFTKLLQVEVALVNIETENIRPPEQIFEAVFNFIKPKKEADNEYATRN